MRIFKYWTAYTGQSADQLNLLGKCSSSKSKRRSEIDISIRILKEMTNYHFEYSRVDLRMHRRTEYLRKNQICICWMKEICENLLRISDHGTAGAQHVNIN